MGSSLPSASELSKRKSDFAATLLRSVSSKRDTKSALQSSRRPFQLPEVLNQEAEAAISDLHQKSFSPWHVARIGDQKGLK